MPCQTMPNHAHIAHIAHINAINALAFVVVVTTKTGRSFTYIVHRQDMPRTSTTHAIYIDMLSFLHIYILI